MNPCERCHERPAIRGRRYRCHTCRRLVCIRCANVGGYGAGHRWAECRDCQREREVTK